MHNELSNFEIFIFFKFQNRYFIFSEINHIQYKWIVTDWFTYTCITWNKL